MQADQGNRSGQVGERCATSHAARPLTCCTRLRRLDQLAHAVPVHLTSRDTTKDVSENSLKNTCTGKGRSFNRNAQSDCMACSQVACWTSQGLHGCNTFAAVHVPGRCLTPSVSWMKEWP